MAYNVKLDLFEGPFDLLVYLIENAEMSIYDIQISEITSQYFEYIEYIQELNLDLASEFLVLAATLIEIKSKMLLPSSKKDEAGPPAEDPRNELVQKILEYKKYKNAAEVLETCEDRNLKIYYKPQEDFNQFINKDSQDEYIDLDLDQFIKAFNLFLLRKKKIGDIQKRYGEVKRERISIEDKISYIKNYFKEKNKLSFNKLISYSADKHEIIVTFIAMLELIRQKFLSVKQNILFGDIILYKNNGGNAA